MAQESQSGAKREKLLTLLPNCDENLDKMSAIVNKNKDRLTALHQQWEEHVAALEVEHEKLCSEVSSFEVNFKGSFHIVTC